MPKSTLKLYTERCVQLSKNWGKTVQIARDSCAGIWQLHTTRRTAVWVSVGKAPQNARAYTVLKHSFPQSKNARFTDTTGDFYPLYTPPITTTTKYINIIGRSA